MHDKRIRRILKLMRIQWYLTKFTKSAGNNKLPSEFDVVLVVMITANTSE